jgi:hypothetical protein
MMDTPAVRLAVTGNGQRCDLNERLARLEQMGDESTLEFVEAQYRGQKQLLEDLQASVDEFVLWVKQNWSCEIAPDLAGKNPGDNYVPMHRVEDILAKLRELGFVKDEG